MPLIFLWVDYRSRLSAGEPRTRKQPSEMSPPCMAWLCMPPCDFFPFCCAIQNSIALIKNMCLSFLICLNIILSRDGFNHTCAVMLTRTDIWFYIVLPLPLPLLNITAHWTAYGFLLHVMQILQELHNSNDSWNYYSASINYSATK